MSHLNAFFGPSFYMANDSYYQRRYFDDMGLGGSAMAASHQRQCSADLANVYAQLGSLRGSQLGAMYSYYSALRSQRRAGIIMPDLGKEERAPITCSYCSKRLMPDDRTCKNCGAAR